MTDDDLIEVLQANAQNAPKHPNGQPNCFPPATSQQIEEAERALGFELPILLQRILCEIGNGGCRLGPTHGIYGVATGYSNRAGENLIDLTSGFAREFEWWEQFIVISEGGCGLFYCVDCADSEGQVYYFRGDEYGSWRFDKNFDPEVEPESGWDVECESFREWLKTPNSNTKY